MAEIPSGVKPKAKSEIVRLERQAAELRANLAKRKTRIRAQAAQAKGSAPEPDPHDVVLDEARHDGNGSCEASDRTRTGS